MPRERKNAFSAFWLGQSAAAAASQLREFVVPVFAVVALGATPVQLGVVAAAQWLPFVVLAIPLGVLFDRSDSRWLLVLSQVGSVLAVGGLAIATLLGATSVAALVVAVFVGGVFTVVFEIGYQSAVPRYVTREALTGANGRLQASAAIADIGGPGLGGLLVQAFGAATALLATAVANLVSTIGFARLPARPVPPADSGRWAALREGVAFAVADPYLRANVGFSAIYNLFAQWVAVLFAAYVLRDLGLEPWMVGVVFAVGAAGALAGAAFAGRIAARVPVGRILVACASVETVAYLAIPALGPAWPQVVHVVVLSGVWALIGVGTAVSNVLLITMRQLRAPVRLLGRVNASMRTVTYGVIPVGATVGGVLGELLGLRLAILVGSFLLLLTIVWVALSPLARVRTMEELEPALSGSTAERPRAV